MTRCICPRSHLFATPGNVRKALMAVVVLSAVLSSAQVTQVPEVYSEVKHDVSPPLRDMAALHGESHAITLHVKPLGKIPRAVRVQPDPVLQTRARTALAASIQLNFEGLGQGQYGFVVDSVPPDTNGAVGSTQFVQAVNVSFAVFNKTTGALVSGPHTLSSLFTGFGGVCETGDDTDPIVVYDKAADRWVLTRAAAGTNFVAPFMQCVAVSQTSDAGGAYFRYAFQFTNTNDYPKLGVWPDAYYLSANMFNGNTFVGARACALDRSNMLNGTAATMVCFQQNNTVFTLLPADLDGSNPPPGASPGFFIQFDDNLTSLDLYKFHVDFGTPGNSTFTSTSIGVSAFTPTNCNGGSVSCIPQAGTTQKLDSLSDRLMHRLAYRHFLDGHEALVVNHTVGTPAGVRWYEIRDPNGTHGTPFVFQSGTFAPDSTYRWTGSIAMDKAGNIALGYSASSSSINPGIRITGRAPSDPIGTLQAETNIMNGTGSQTSIDRWGDYTSMSIDPVDDCTFWYTNEYLAANGSFNWHTRIASFKMPGCGPTVPDLSISKTHSGNFFQGQTGATYTLTVTNFGTAPTSGTVTVTDTLPAGLTATAISGTGWNCTLATLTCTRSDALGSGASYPVITLTVNVGSSAPALVTNSALVSGGGSSDVSDNDPTTVVVTPTITTTLTSQPPAPVPAGGSFGSTFSVSSNFAAQASVSCSVNAPLTTCIINSSSSTVQINVPSSITITVKTTGPNALNKMPQWPRWVAPVLAAMLGLPGIVVVAPWTTRRGRSRRSWWVAWLSLLVLAVLLAGCSGGGSSGGGGGSTTPPGAYKATVTATSNGVQGTATVNFTVQ